MSLKDNLPAFVADEKYTSEILDAIEPEIDKIRTEIIKLILECCISTCSEYGLAKYEKDYAIPYNAEFSIDERKREVINKMLAKRSLTKEEFANFIKRNIDNKQFYISNLAEEYEFTIALIDEEYKDKLYDAIYRARPAHLKFEIILTSYERRCGTFHCNEHTI